MWPLLVMSLVSCRSHAPPKTCSLGDPQPNPPVHMGTPSTSVPWEIFKFVHLGTCSYPFQICSNLLPPANEVWRKVMFLHLSVIHSFHGGVLSLAEGAILSVGCCPWGCHPLQGVPSLGGGAVKGVAMKGGGFHEGMPWKRGGGFCESGCHERGAMKEHSSLSTSGRYASYWNAFLFTMSLLVHTSVGKWVVGIQLKCLLVNLYFCMPVFHWSLFKIIGSSESQDTSISRSNQIILKTLPLFCLF